MSVLDEAAIIEAWERGRGASAHARAARRSDEWIRRIASSSSVSSR